MGTGTFCMAEQGSWSVQLVHDHLYKLHVRCFRKSNIDKKFFQFALRSNGVAHSVVFSTIMHSIQQSGPIPVSDVVVMPVKW